ncbi:TonB-dependent receptor [Niabella beijingensis]|uniref:TonB-dependent receptor n=1 Tax=Niabella beijingensis TaxID=2872700 RepID=UPI001CBDAB25|nr:TonB-dependent receptor [Niabella beijingensis]MBZ4192564.1 carboxypeptidase-like regulatory domain-containing protein [Niabella beijingensis]
MQERIITLLTTLLSLAFAEAAVAQEVKLKGRVLTENNSPAAFATIILDSTDYGTTTNENGNYAINNLKPGHYKIIASAVNNNPQQQEIDCRAGETVVINFTLKKQTGSLDEVKVSSSSAHQELKTQIINTAAFKEQPSTLIELMNRSAGIRIRQTGGLGGRSDLMLNGFQNRSIKFFKDGIPLDYLGSGFDISLVPVNMLDRVEVYKGVLPFSLGADALGGAVNMIGRHTFTNFLNVAYEFGSFNTHRVSLNTYHTNRSGRFFAGLNGFYNYSDNDYRADVQTLDPETGIKEDYRARLFHNKFSNDYLEGYTGVKNLSWADELKLSVTAFSINRQLQFGSTMDQPFGAAKGLQNAVVPALNYKKQLWNDQFSINQFVAYSAIRSKTIDTAHGSYDWRGVYTYNPSGIGELSAKGSLSDILFQNYISRSNLTYALNGHHRLNLNAVYNKYRRTGEDPYGNKFKNGVDALTPPAGYEKFIVALGLTSDFPSKKLQNSFALKWFRYQTNATDADFQGNEVTTQNKRSAWGVSEGLRFNVSQYASFYLSGESALRLPELDELFGDGNLKLSNFNLKPERSINISLSYKVAVPGNYSAEINTFYRRTKDMILLMPHNLLFSQSQNVENVHGYGLDADGRYFITRWLDASANFTYQNLRVFNTGYQLTEGARLRNTPYFFANAGLNAKFRHVALAEDNISIYCYYSFVREYYLDYIPRDLEPDGFLGLFGRANLDARNIIPNQHLVTAGFTYFPYKSRYSIGLQVKNLFNEAIYDNFKIQNPGRNFSVKLNYSL